MKMLEYRLEVLVLEVLTRNMAVLPPVCDMSISGASRSEPTYGAVTCERTVSRHQATLRCSRPMSGGHASGHDCAEVLPLAAASMTRFHPQVTGETRQQDSVSNMGSPASPRMRLYACACSGKPHACTFSGALVSIARSTVSVKCMGLCPITYQCTTIAGWALQWHAIGVALAEYC